MVPITKRVCAAALGGLAMAGVAAADPLVIDGVEIADAELFAAAQAEGGFVLYGTYPPSSAALIHDVFTEQTGIEIEYVRAPTGSLFPRIQTEAAAGQLAADLIDLTDLPLVQELVEAGILDAPHLTPSFEALPEVLREDEGRWYVYIRPTYIFAVNTAVIEGELPTRWADFLNPEHAGNIGIPSIDAGGSALSAYTFMRQELGEQFLVDLAATGPRIYPSLAPMVNDLVRGEVVISMTDAGFLMGQKAQGAPVQEVFPEEGIPSFPVAAGVVSGASNPNAAKVFLNWMTSVPGSNAVTLSSAYGIHPDAGVPTTADFPPVDQVWNFGMEEWLTLREGIIDDWHGTFGN